MQQIFPDRGAFPGEHGTSGQNSCAELLIEATQPVRNCSRSPAAKVHDSSNHGVRGVFGARMVNSSQRLSMRLLKRLRPVVLSVHSGSGVPRIHRRYTR